ncbi:MAG: hypothetical protein K2N23_05995 [Clostridia bacterium]|nr:hypothetical protein [Clostridia bacterium]
MKSIFKFTALAAGMIGACAMLGGCGGGNDSAEKFSKEEFYGVGAVSCVQILGSTLNAQSAKTFTSLAQSAAAASDDIKAQAENFNKYFAALDSFLDDSAMSVTTEKNTDAAYSQFATKLTVKGKDIAGNATEYVMYYNETFVGQTTDKDETESRYTLEGVMISEDVEYRLTGGKQIEVENGEREEELRMRAYIGEATGDFVEMKHEVSVEDNERETEYVYRVYSNNMLVEETKVEFGTETKKGKTETEYELEFIKGGSKGKYKVEREVKNGVTEISVKYNLNGESGKFRIKEIIKDGQPYYEYIFDDNSTCSFQKHSANHEDHHNH